ncbi:hypothetical protein BDW75DRAFT_237924 [Aspergillus navahoensis]
MPINQCFCWDNNERDLSPAVENCPDLYHCCLRWFTRQQPVEPAPTPRERDRRQDGWRDCEEQLHTQAGNEFERLIDPQPEISSDPPPPYSEYEERLSLEAAQGRAERQEAKDVDAVVAKKGTEGAGSGAEKEDVDSVRVNYSEGPEYAAEMGQEIINNQPWKVTTCSQDPEV